ncbi:MAG: type II toxin-antitoxin system HicB family antitoxin [Cyanobacteria bacterium J06600_6]
MSLDNYDFDGFVINLYVDEQGDWLAHFQEISTVSAFGDTPQEALEELKVAWELVKEDYQEKNIEIP